MAPLPVSPVIVYWQVSRSLLTGPGMLVQVAKQAFVALAKRVVSSRSGRVIRPSTRRLYQDSYQVNGRLHGRL